MDIEEEVKDEIEEIIQRSVTLPVAIGIGILGVGVGFAAGYILARLPNRPKPLSVEEQEEVDEIRQGIEAMKADRVGAVVIDEAAYRAREKRVQKIEVQAPDEDIEPVTIDRSTVRQNIFAQTADPEDDWDYAEELKHRNTKNPYVIHRDEFFAEDGEHDFHQHQLTFYNGDKVLIDEERNPVYNHTDVVGEMKFGHGSGDPNVVYIRNERLKADYEVWLDGGRFDVEVEGADIEDVHGGLQHSSGPVVKKFRPE